MTETEWRSCDEPMSMLRVFRGKTSARKLVLFSCACVRRIGECREGSLRDLADFAELYADGSVPLHELRRRVATVGREGRALPEDPWEWAACHTDRERQHDVSPSERLAILRDIFDNPFRPVAFSAEWRTSTVVALARGMYESQDFAPMPILADGLQDAGCGNDDILTHCRFAGPHVRGCWVVDLVLGKT